MIMPVSLKFMKSLAVKTVVTDAARAGSFLANQRHNAAVREAIAPDRLLVFEVAEGWEKLCSFLDRPVPEEDFPRLNDSASFRDRFSGAFAAETV